MPYVARRAVGASDGGRESLRDRAATARNCPSRRSCREPGNFPIIGIVTGVVEAHESVGGQRRSPRGEVTERRSGADTECRTLIVWSIEREVAPTV